MPTEFLTTLKVRSIKEPGAYLDGRGLRLVVTVSGTKRWELWIKVNGRRREFGLGVYPDVSLHDARTKADEMRRTARDGGEIATKRSRQKVVTFRDAFETCFARRRRQLSNAKHLKQWPSTMKAYVFPLSTTT